MEWSDFVASFSPAISSACSVPCRQKKEEKRPEKPEWSIYYCKGKSHGHKWTNIGVAFMYSKNIFILKCYQMIELYVVKISGSKN